MSRARLPYVVECKSVLPFYEAIAAFDHPAPALRYAADCKAANPRFAYRVTSRGKVLPTPKSS